MVVIRSGKRYNPRSYRYNGVNWFSNMSLESQEQKSKSSGFTRCHIVLILVVGLLFLGVGILIGYLINKGDGGPPKQEPSNAQASNHRQRDIDIIMRKLSKDNIRDNLKVYASRPRMAGTPGGYELEKLLYKTWRDHGLDQVREVSYDVLLSYPNTSNPNKVQLLENGTVIFQSALTEELLGTEQHIDEIIPPFNAYAAAGVTEGELIYVNYGRIEDFKFLEGNKSINFNGKIAIARYGKIFRGDKVKIAEQFNCSGIIMYTDPSDFNINSGANSTVYPDSWWMPETGVQRGTVGNDGDALTPFYPATDYAHRMNKADIEAFTIPAQPISYGDAWNLLRVMDGEEVPPSWRGKLNITYRFGPGYNRQNLKVRLEVNNYEEVRKVSNIIGYVRGSVEPDRYILLGNHHDAWVFGAIDPLSGTAVSTEITRVLGEMLKEGIRPRRTIVVCAWGGEEHGLLGSVEWVEEYMKVLYERAVAYLNVDYACDYHYSLVAGVSPLLQDPLYQAAKKVPNADASSDNKTLYSIWLQRDSMDDDLNGGKIPSVYYSLGSGSDMASFYQRAGVPSVDMWYDYDYRLWDILSYPVYHSQYETVYLYENFIDPGYRYTLSVAQLWTIFAWNLANDEVLTFDTRRYAAAITSFIKQLDKNFGEEWRKHNISFTDLEAAAQKLTTITATFQSKADKLRNSPDASELEKRMINDRLIQFERAFIDPEGLPGRRIYKHVMFAPSKYDSYSDNSFPGITDTMHDIQYRNETDKWDLVRQQISVAIYTIHSAANTLEEIGL